MKLTVIFATVLSLSVVTQAIPLEKRRFGVEHSPEADATFQEIKDIAQGTDKEAQAGNLSGAMVRALLAKAPACDQQDRADEIIDLGIELGGDKKDQLVKLAQTYRQLERNTPNAGQPSELCKKPPKNKELDGLTQAQDPTGDGKQPEDPKKPKDDPKKPKDDPKKPKEDPKKPKDDPKKPKDDPKKPKDDPKKPKDDPKKPKDDPKKPKDDPKKPKDDPKKPKDDPKKPKDDPKKPKEDPKTADPTGENFAETNPVGGVKMPKIVKQNGDFLVNGNGFNGNLDAAHGRQCDVQHNLCFNKFNSGDKSFSGADCDNQTNVCKSGPPVFA